MQTRLATVFSTLLALLAAGLLFSCASEPNNPLRSLETRGAAPKPTARLASRAGESLDQVGIGYWVFQRKCLECHEVLVPKNPTDPAWHPVITGMLWNAGLPKDEEKAVMAYLRAAAR